VKNISGLALTLLACAALTFGSACSKKSSKPKVVSDPSEANHEYVPIPKNMGAEIDPAKDSNPNQE